MIEICFDCETGGLTAKENPITQIALIAFNSETGEVLGEYETFVGSYLQNPVYTKIALEKTGIKMSQIESAPAARIVLENLKKFFKKFKPSPRKKPTLIGHNVPFDIGMLSEMFRYFGEDLSEWVDSNNRIIVYNDTMQMGYQRWRKFQKKDETLRMNLAACCERAGVELVSAHTAMADTRATLELYKVLCSYMRGTGAKAENAPKSEGLREKWQF